MKATCKNSANLEQETKTTKIVTYPLLSLASSVIKADQKSFFYPSINDIYILYPKYLKKRQCHYDNVALSEDTKANKQKARTSHFKSTSGQQFSSSHFQSTYVRLVVNNDFFAS